MTLSLTHCIHIEYRVKCYAVQLKMNWKPRGRKLVWPNLRYYYRIFLECLSKTMTYLSVDRQSLE